MNDNLDELLAELRRGTPFSVDWTEYEREVLRRLGRREAARKRSAWWLAALGACAGAAAACVIMASRIGLRAVPTGAGTAATPQVITRTKVQEQEPPAAATAAVEREAGPYMRVTRGVDGVVSRIRFDGFSAPGAQGPRMIAAVSRRAK